ncbi:MAG: S-layer homology domain-containing protein [Candidatus Xenobiia bacterium LiM19]
MPSPFGLSAILHRSKTAANTFIEVLFMKMLLMSFFVVCLLFLSCQSTNAAPLFGDVPDEHWAHDAVANLAAKGLVEGYPDGTFKGVSSATRFEMTMIVARFLAKNDAEHAAFASKSDLDELRKLAVELKDELEALGVRVTNLEENVRRIDLRVAEKERITF